ncbi:UvrD-helicase domain-containing protein [Patescibacteria group bacterium]|nr:UvrD-helicase domain-containing protein [Patescibacteria group bacterium]
MNNDLSKKLNTEQKKAVTHSEGPLLIVAGAGTGKTTVITQRLAWLIEQKKATGDEILALTFTDKAAGEMEERVDKLLPYGYLDLWISTFHSFAERILKENALEIGLSYDFKLLNQTQQWLLVRKNLERFNLDYYKPLGNPTKFIQALIKLFSRAKDETVTPEDYLKYVKELKLNSDEREFAKTIIDDDLRKSLTKKEQKELIASEIKKQEEVADAYHVYQQLLLENNALDFGDLITYCLKLLKERPLVLNKYRKQFKYILVDEFQDTNHAQYELIKILAEPKNNITVVGDDDQCLPPETLIDTQSGKKAIKNIKAGDSVITAVGKGHLGFSNVKKVKKNIKEVRLLTIKTKTGCTLTATDNHKMFCYIPAIANKKYYYVYLMNRQDIGWRLGVTNDLATRLRLERSADKIIGLKTFKTENKARYYETMYSLKYGIPTVCFQKRKGIVIKDDFLKKLYQEINVTAGVINLSQDLNIDLNFYHSCLAGVNRGNKLRVKINLELCHRSYRSKSHVKQGKPLMTNPLISHFLYLQTSNQKVINKLLRHGFNLTKAKKGYRLRIRGEDIEMLTKTANQIERITGGITEATFKVGRLKHQHLPAVVLPAKNLLKGHFLPVRRGNNVEYEEIVGIKEEIKKETVYDLEIEKTHNFIAEGIVVHNSIFKFRGASISNILEFKKDYSNAEEVFLTKNYRSTQEILDLSYKFIKQNNPYRLEVKLKQDGKKLSKKLKSQVKMQGLINHLHLPTIEDEVKTVIKQIVDLKNKEKDVVWNDFAILVRANASANLFIYGLDKAEIPYQFVASSGLYSKPIVLDILAYLKLMDNYHEGTALFRILSLPVFGLEHKDLVNLNYWSRRKGQSLYATMQTTANLTNVDDDVRIKLKKILDLISKHTQLVKDKKVGEIIIAFLEESGHLQNITKVDSQKTQNTLNILNQFYKKVVEFENSVEEPTVQNFLEMMEFQLEAGDEGALQNNIDEGPDCLKVMTVHGAKGLEFKYVFIVNLVDRRFPTISRTDPIELPEKLIKEILPEGDVHLQEERRLFYVAMTRAKQGLFLTSAEDYGGHAKKKLSRFLTELSEFRLNLSEKIKTEGKSLIEQKKEKISHEIDQNSLNVIVPTKFSFTQLRAFESCPYQYRFAHVLRVPVRGKAVFSFGKTIHATLQKFFELVQQRSGTGQKDLFGNKEASKNDQLATLDELIEIYRNTWIDDWYTSQQEQEDYKKKGEQALKDLYKSIKDNIPVPVFLERPFNVRIDQYTLKGVIDRVDETKGGVEIIDYKTGKVKGDNPRAEDKEQLLIYQMAGKTLFDKPVKLLSYYYVEGNKKVSFLGTEKELEKLQNKIVKTIQEIKKGEFPPTPSQLCKWCDFRNICEYRVT